METAEIIVATVPFENSYDTITQLAAKFKGGQILISAAATVTKQGNEFRPSSDESSLSQRLRNVLPSTVEVATAFQTVPANILFKERSIRSDVLVSCDSQATYEKVAQVVSSVEGLRPLYIGSLALSGEVERLTALLLNVAIKNRLKSPTFQVNSF